MPCVAAWDEFEREEPEFAARVKELFDAHVHKTIATLRRDGSPRISGIECTFAEGELWIGSMPRAVKARDLQRDPRYALHSGSDDPPDWTADAKVGGRAEEVTDPGVWERVYGRKNDSGAHLFRLDIDEAVIAGLNEARNGMVIELWKPGEGVRVTERD